MRRPEAGRWQIVEGFVVFGFWFAVCAWIQAETLVLADSPLRFGEFTRPALAGLGLSLLFVLPLALVMAFVWRGNSRARSFAQSQRAALSEPTHEASSVAEWSAALYAGSLCVVAFCACSWLSTRELVLRVARPDNIAALVLAVQLGLLLTSLAIWEPLRGLLKILVQALARVPRVGVIWRTPAGHLATVGALFFLVVTILLVHQSRVLFMLPWTQIAVLLAAAVGGALSLMLHVRLVRPRRLLRRLELALVGFASFGGLVLGLTLRGTSHAGYEAMAGRVPLASGGLALIRQLLDLDGDGQLWAFGGGDCAPFDDRVYTGAVEILDNGIDEDCDGHDMVSTRSPKTSSFNHPIPEGWPSRPNVYLLTIDAFAPFTLSDFGGSEQAAPFLNELARQSLLFKSCFAQGPSTRLSLPALFTSRYDSTIARRIKGRFPFSIKAKNVLLAEIFRDAGYQTIAIAPDPYFLPSHWGGIHQGFSVVDVDAALAAKKGLEHTAALVTRRALHHLEKPRKGAAPIFLWAHYFDAHPPHTPVSSGSGQAETPARQAYLDEMGVVDRALHRLISKIRAHDPQGLVMVTGDHAIAFDTPRHESHHYGYDLSTNVLHVPLIVSAPFVRPGRSTQLVTTLDITPTLVNLLRVAGSYSFEGDSLVPALVGKRLQRPPVIFSQFFVAEDTLVGREPLRLVGARTPRFNLVIDRRRGVVQAWDWRADPDERDDLWGRSASGALQAELVHLRGLAERFVSTTRLEAP